MQSDPFLWAHGILNGAHSDATLRDCHPGDYLKVIDGKYMYT